MKTRRTAMAVALALAPLMVIGLGTTASAHGSNEFPISRNWRCVSTAGSIWNTNSYKGEDACKQAVGTSTDRNAYGTWQQMAWGDVAGMHHSKIPDGKLASAGVKGFEGMDTRRKDWKRTNLASLTSKNGDIEFRWHATATHQGHISYYITKPGTDVSKPLKWSDLEDTPFLVNYTSDARNSEKGMVGDYSMNARLPEGLPHGDYVIYAVWERYLGTDGAMANAPADFVNAEAKVMGTNRSDESFYAAMDVTL
ncbi:lytic polysaccharide monooxygenase [Streptomyces sp. NPDC002537]